MSRIARSADTRESAARPKTYVPRAKLVAPTPPPGYKGRWIRIRSGATDDADNVSNREYEGYRFVTAEEAARWEGTDKWRGTQDSEGIVSGRKDLRFAVNAVENTDARQDYYSGLAQRQMDEIDANMYKAASEAPGHMTFREPKRRTIVKTGPGASKPQFADDTD